MKTIGGFIEWGDNLKRHEEYHQNALFFSSGRASLLFLLMKIKPKHVYLPYYCCDALLYPFKRLGIPYTLYQITDSLEPMSIPNLKANEYFLYINYFGLKSSFTHHLFNVLGDQLIIDNTQNYFARDEVPTYSFNSARKFFGVPDGSFLYHVFDDNSHLPNGDYSIQHLVEKLLQNTDQAYELYRLHESKIGMELLRGSLISRVQLQLIDHRECWERRSSNFGVLHSHLGKLNEFKLEWNSIGAPMVYPLMLKAAATRENFYSDCVFLASYWPEVLTRSSAGFDVEKKIVRHSLFLPIDQRYNQEDMMRMVQLIKGYVNKIDT